MSAANRSVDAPTPREMVMLTTASPQYGSELGVDVRIVGLEPVSKRPPEHASGGSGGSAFHDVMLPVEEVGRITWIEGKRREAVERGELRRRPLPAISDQVCDAERAVPGWIGAHRSGVPPSEIEIAMDRLGRGVTPRIRAFAAGGSAIGGTVKLGFGRQ